MSRILLRPTVIAITVYLLMRGATFSGIMGLDAPITLVIIALTAAAWLFAHYRSGWKWHRTPLDFVFLLWVAAFVISLLANWDDARRIAIGLWYVAVYIGVWYILQDALANHGLTRDLLVDALFVGGFFIMLVGYWQLENWLTKALNFHLSLLSPPRPDSIFGNPNFLSAFLIVIIPLLFSRLLIRQRPARRILLGIYTLLALPLLFLTFSRAAWLGMVVGAAVWLGLILAQKGLLSRQSLSVWWGQQTRRLKQAIAAGIVVVVVVGLLMAVLFVHSLSETGRTADLRLDIYQAAVELFAEKPITGQGLFTFGRGLVRLPDVQPDKPHSHAHDAVLHIAAELGIIGLIALSATLVVMTRVIRSNWRVTPGNDQIMLVGAVGAVVAFAVHQLGDIPAMMPAIALTGLVALILAMAPVTPQPLTATWTHYAYPLGFASLWMTLLITGAWSHVIYAQYVSILSDAIKTSDYLGDAQRLQMVIDADPKLSLYSLEQAFLFGMAASEGNSDAARTGIVTYQHFIDLDPGYALAWANMAGLRWQIGDQPEAIKDMHQAIYLDSNVWQYHMNLAAYAQVTGDGETVTKEYQQVLDLYPDASLYPDYPQLAAARQASNKLFNLTPQAQVALLLDNHKVEQAEQVWKQNPQPEATSTDIINELLALAKQDKDDAIHWLMRGEPQIANITDEGWVHLGRARLATFLGQSDLAASELQDAQTILKRTPMEADDNDLANIAYAQFLRYILPRLFLPQVDYRVDDPVLLHLLAASS